MPATEPAPASRPDRIRQGDREKAYRPLPLDVRRAAFDEGVAAYDRGDFFAAHEALEPAWMGSDDLEERALHQGLIKVAAAYVHAVRHNPAGIARNLTGARLHLAQTGCRGCRVGRGRGGARRRHRRPPGRPDARRHPARDPEDPAAHEPSRRHPGRRPAVRGHPPLGPAPAGRAPRRPRGARVPRGPRPGLAVHPDVGARRPRGRGAEGPARCSSCAPPAHGRSR